MCSLVLEVFSMFRQDWVVVGHGDSSAITKSPTQNKTKYLT
jgi:hypothetical protein